MASPTPPVSLQSSCSISLNDTLYVYTPAAFLSLPLKANATWSTIPASGVSVTGAVCIQGFENGPGTGDALWVVGGSANSSMQDYPGLQYYSFSKQTWTSVTPITKVTQNRINHAAAYINSTGEILVYAGSQDHSSTPSIQTFLLQTTPPFNVLSSSSNNYPAVAPILLAWNDTAAIAMGGSSEDQSIYMFNTAAQGQGKWSNYGTSLTQPLKPSNQELASLVHGSDGSKVLQLYDMSVSPNVVSNLVLQEANGQPAPGGQTIGGQPSKKRKRDLTLKNWPSYNSTAAPTYTRTGYSIAQDPSGLTALVGGNDQHAVALFDQDTNTWVDTGKFFGLDDANVQSVLATSTSAVSTPSATATASSSPSPTALPGTGSQTSVILGAVLGTILGFIFLLILALLFIRIRRQNKQRAAAAQAVDDEKRRMSFADRGAPFMMDGAGDKPTNPAHSSIAILGSGQIPHHERSLTRGSDSSTANLVARKGPMGQSDVMEMSPIGEKHHESDGTLGNRTLGLASDSSRGTSSNYLSAPKRSSGWSRYFSGNSSVAPAAAAGAVGGTLAAGNKIPRKASGLSNVGRASTDNYSNYTTDSNHTLPALKLGQDFDGGRISRVVTGSAPSSPPGTSHSNKQASSFRNSRPRTMNSEMSDQPSTIDETLFGGPGHEDGSQWTPVMRNDWSTPATRDRDTVTSSIYSHNDRHSESNGAASLKRINEAGYQAKGGQEHNSANYSMYSATTWTPKMGSARVSDPDTWPRPPSASSAKSWYRPSEKPPPLPTFGGHEGDEDDEAPNTPTAVTAIPVPASTAMQYTVVKKASKPSATSDMSWLNLNPTGGRT